MRRKRCRRRRSTRRKPECSDSSVELDSFDYSHDGEENGREKDKDNSKKEEDDDRSVSDDSLEVIVVKKSLEKKCEKVVSGRRSKTPRECTRETKLTKMHKRKKMSKNYFTIQLSSYYPNDYISRIQSVYIIFYGTYIQNVYCTPNHRSNEARVRSSIVTKPILRTFSNAATIFLICRKILEYAMNI